MVEMRSLVGDADRGFVPVEEFAGPCPKRGDLESAVVLEANGVTLLDTDMWDSVDLLWALIVRGAHEFRDNGQARIRFPDQPIFVTLRRSGADGVRLDVEWPAGHRSSWATREELLAAVRQGAVTFFELLLELSPPSDWKYREQLRSAQTL
ncbi:hypothetical protein FH609_019075 [Streptomyces sp. 3MP-14]|uniref:Uncharacterized protein n=1 Tax=Streptomyces mimosae TaxID=2586635 RepID=A0A5N6A4Q0_9ACTN|nr:MULTISPECIES: hypothetical protein [Streptomyces]KAB8163764.1 hypothetical protein FH607_017615 [Streptomyces mimosae]KAB8175207.1 hypothetical protein FH609_019075 [Streptomyces sp. 3MP-14]